MLKSTDAGILEAVLPAATSRSLGALLLFKRNDTWKTVGADARRTFDLDDPAVLKRWEKSLASRIYKVYGYHENPTAAWEFFTLLEFSDLENWQQLQKNLDASGFSTYYTWDVVALGRRLG
ncbi:MAG: hypothetical protein QGG64_03320 [Candidatus Latescibacteria bacterium]|nr:hypothetical protein [Candidatus Latescibacterota bacterium]